ncbi:MAG: MEDS domain-containing protein [Steroidobacteraceae bacterium]
MASESVSEAESVLLDLAPHEHCCYLYDSPRERLATLCRFLRAGLLRGEKCLYVGGDRAIDAIRHALASARVRVAQAQSSGAIEFKAARKIYLPRGDFEAEKTLAMWRRAAAKAKSDGFAGLRVVSEASGDLRRGGRREEWLEYERGLTQSLGEMEATFLCVGPYRSTPRWSARDELKLHPFGLAGGVFGRSLYCSAAAASDLPEAQSRRRPGAQVSIVTARPEPQDGLAHVLVMSALVAAIVHEIRQPLAAVAANANAGLRWLKVKQPRLARARRSLSLIVRDVTRAGEIISRVRALAKRDTESERQLLDVAGVIREALLLAKAELRSSCTSLRLELARNMPPVRGDPLQLQQVVLNLASNALEAMSRVGPRDRELRILAAPRTIGTIVVTVQDTGVGFGPGGAAQAFEPFHTTKPHGLGIGLWICRTIVEAHGGRLWVTPNAGPGASVHFSLPSQSERRQ